MKIYVGNLPFQMTEDDLRAAFQAHGDVDSVRIVTDQETGRSRGFGFVEMADHQQAKAAIETLNGRRFEYLLQLSPAIEVRESTLVDNSQVFEMARWAIKRLFGDLDHNQSTVPLIDSVFFDGAVKLRLEEFEMGLQIVSIDPDMVGEDLRFLIVARGVTIRLTLCRGGEGPNVGYIIDLLSDTGFELASEYGKIYRGLLYDPRLEVDVDEGEEVVEF